MEAVLNGWDFGDLKGFYTEVNRLLAPGITMGRNLDALRDVLRGGLGGPEGPILLVWRNSDKSRRDLGYPETVRMLEERLQRCHASARDSIAAALASARRGAGPTAFDQIVEILRSDPRVDLRLE